METNFDKLIIRIKSLKNNVELDNINYEEFIDDIKDIIKLIPNLNIMKDEWTKILNDNNFLKSENDQLNHDIKLKIQEIIKLKNNIKDIIAENNNTINELTEQHIEINNKYEQNESNMLKLTTK
jgi:organic radical activating enzyme